MNAAAKIIITLLSIATEIAIIAGVYMHVWKGRGFSVSSKMVEDKVTLEGEVKNLTVNMDLTDLTVEPGKELSVAYHLPESMVPEVSLQNGTLEIKSPQGMVTLPLNTGNFYVTVTIPEKTDLEEVTLKVDAGNQLVKDLKCGKLEAHGDAGNVDLTNVECTEISTHVDAGNVELKGCHTDTLKARADAGNLDLTDCVVSQIDAEVDAGNIEAKDSSIETGICKTDLGNISLSGNIGDVKTKTSVGDVSINK